MKESIEKVIETLTEYRREAVNNYYEYLRESRKQEEEDKQLSLMFKESATVEYGHVEAYNVAIDELRTALMSL